MPKPALAAMLSLALIGLVQAPAQAQPRTLRSGPATQQAAPLQNEPYRGGVLTGPVQGVLQGAAGRGGLVMLNPQPLPPVARPLRR